jgi:carbamoyl-phosphate synthase large subunit
VIKPKNGRSSEGLEFFDPTTMMHAMSRPDLADCIIQPFIEGNIITVDVLRQASSGTTYCFPRREMIRSKNGTGMSVKTLNIAPIIADCGRLAVHLDLNGMVNIELIESREGLYLMDINPRFSAGIGFTRLGGYDFALNSLRCFTGERLDNYSYMPDRVMIRRFEETIV